MPEHAITLDNFCPPVSALPPLKELNGSLKESSMKDMIQSDIRYGAGPANATGLGFQKIDSPRSLVVIERLGFATQVS
jgi:hypothetical protein